MEIYQMAPHRRVWEISHMPVRPGKKLEAEERAREIHRRLMALQRDPELTNNKWALKAGLNTSFFTSMTDGPNRRPSEPSIGNLRAALEAAGSSIPEFFIEEAKGRLVRAPNAQALERAFELALPDMPRRADSRPRYLAEVVLGLFGLHPDRSATSDNEGFEPEHESEEVALLHEATR